MKKKIFKIARRVVFGLFVLTTLFNFLSIWVLWQMKYKNIATRSIDEQTRRILFHLYGIKNMTTAEKIGMLKQSEDFTENFTDKIDSVVACRVFPDQSARYAVDSNFVINFHLQHGNPEVRIGYLVYFRDHYNPLSEMLLSPFGSKGKPVKISLQSYLTETAHSDQFYQSPYGFIGRSVLGILRSAGLVLITFCSPEKAYSIEYHTPGAIEYEAHSIIGPKLRSDYLDYRKLYFWDQIEANQEELNHGESSYLQEMRDSLVYGPSFSIGE